MILGQDYKLPDNRYVQQPQEQAPVAETASPFFGLPNKNEDLARVEGITDKYYDTRGKIETFALDMQKKYGIDVTQPDYTQPGGGVPFKTYHKLATQLLVTANDLKQVAATKKQLEPYYASGAIQRTQDFDQNSTKPEDQYFSAKLLPEVEQANNILKTSVYTKADQDRFKQQVLDPLVSKLTQAMNQPGISQSEKERLQFNIDALVQQPRTTPYAYFQGQYNGRKSTVEEDILRDTTNLAQGHWPEGTYSKATNDNGDPVFVNRKREGEQYGEHQYTDVKGNEKRLPRLIDHWEKNSGGVYLHFKQADGVDIPPEKVSDMRGDAVASSLISSNAKYGDVRKMYEAAREKGYTDESGSVVNEALLSKEHTTPDPSTFGAGILAEKERIRKMADSLDDPGYWATNKSTLEFELPDGDKVKLFKHRRGKGFYIAGHEGDDEYNHLTVSDIIKELGKKGYFNKFVDEKSSTADKAQSLIDKYKK